MYDLIKKRKDNKMDMRNGNIMSCEEAELLNKELGQLVAKKMKLDPTLEQMARKPPRVGRNDYCPCGSGKKFKKCCLITSVI
jgi:uncharacterized protein YecA (UPF0149 family)